MAIEYTLSASAQGESEWFRMDSTGKAGDNFLLVVDFASDGGSIVDVEFAVQKTLDSDTLCIQHNVLKDLTDSLASTLKAPATAFRLNLKKAGTGTVVLRIIQHED